MIEYTKKINCSANGYLNNKHLKCLCCNKQIYLDGLTYYLLDKKNEYYIDINSNPYCKECIKTDYVNENIINKTDNMYCNVCDKFGHHINYHINPTLYGYDKDDYRSMCLFEKEGFNDFIKSFNHIYNGNEWVSSYVDE